jgi:dolichol-phosphate mannosyltransferase
MEPHATASLADIVVHVPVSVVIPTYREAENIPLILKRLNELRLRHGLTMEVIFVDDDSRDGSVEAVAAAGHDWARILVREGERGLSTAVIAGFRAARYPILVCMDCDLSHPPEAIPRMILGLAMGQQMVLGSRYVPGGSTEDDWGILRWLNSAVATLMARPLTSVRDPMSGFFVLQRADFAAARDLNPVGYKIALELIVKCDFENVGEVPIRFVDRAHGQSKLSLREQLKYIQHLRRLYLYRFSHAMYLAQFLTVGALGTVVNLTILGLLLFLGAPEAVALAGGIAVSVCTNFLLNRRFTFSYARYGHMGRQFVGFVLASGVGFVVNYSVAILLRQGPLTEMPGGIYLAAMCGICAGMSFNFLGNRYLVFAKRFLRR